VTEVQVHEGSRVVGTLVASIGVVVVVTARQQLDDLLRLDQLTELVDEHPRPLLVGEEQPEALVLVDDHLELTHVGRVVDHHLVADADRQLHDLPEVLRGAREDGQAPRLRAVEPAVDQLLHPLQVGQHRRLGPEAGLRVLDQQIG
jgi:hypothetical protein